MTNEQKLQILVNIALQNGFNCYTSEMIAHSDSTHTFSLTDDIMLWNNQEYGNAKYLSLNDLVTQNKGGKIGFVRALYHACSKLETFEEWRNTLPLYQDSNFYRDDIVIHWVLLPDEERLSFLLDTFSHLIVSYQNSL